jgi:hypothetical protein
MKDYALHQMIKTVITALENECLNPYSPIALGKIGRAQMIENLHKEVLRASLTSNAVKVKPHKNARVPKVSIIVNGKKLTTMYENEYNKIMSALEALPLKGGLQNA